MLRVVVAVILTLAWAAPAGASVWTIAGDHFGTEFVTPLAVHDFNGDGSADVLVGRGAEMALLVGPRFDAIVPVTQPALETFGDFNGDGIPDLATPGENVTVALANGQFGFLAPKTRTLIAPQFESRGRVFGDFDGDHKTDALVATRADGANTTLTSALSTGNGDFGPARTQTLDAVYTVVAAADFNGDGRDDLLAHRFGGVLALLSTGTAFTPVGTPLEVDGPYGLPFGVVTGDFDGNGAADAAVLDHNVAKTFLGASDGRLRAGPVLPNIGSVGGPGRAPVAADVDDDGLDDVIATDGSALLVFYGSIDGGLEPPLATACACTSPVVGDLDGDGRPDLAVSRSGTGIRLLLNTSAPELSTPPGLQFSGVVLGASDEDFVEVENTGDRAFLLRSLQVTGAHASDFSVVDMDCLGVYFRQEYCDVVIRFTPAGDGSRTANLIVDTDSEPSRTVTLGGTGIRPPQRAPAAQPPAPRPVPSVPAFAGVTLAKPALRNTTVSTAITCPRIAVGACTGTVTLKTAGRKPLTAGRAKFSIAPGKRATVKVKLSRAARALLKRRGRLSLVATTVAVDSRNTRVTVKRAFVVRAKRN